MIKTYNFVLGTGFAGCVHSTICELEFDDNATYEEINREVRFCFDEWMWGRIEAGWEEIKEVKSDDD